METSLISTFERAEPQHLSEFEKRLEGRLAEAAALDQASQRLTEEIFRSFAPCVLARVYATVPFGALPERNRVFVRDLATAKGAGARVHPDTQVLSLLGSYGVEKAWTDRRQSRGHVGIPLIDAAFVEGIPMIARLMHELGADLRFPGAGAGGHARKLAGGFNGVFHVPDAATARDAQGRLIIPAQDFVEQYAVKSVFGMGGQYLSGSMVACIVFAGALVPRVQAERFARIISGFKSATAQLARAQLFFSTI